MTTLSPHPVYKPSLVSWLGDVPEHWAVLPGRACYTSAQALNQGMLEKTVLSLSYGQIKIRPEEKLHGLVPASFESYQVVESDDIVCRPTDLQNDWNSLRFGLSRYKGIITSAYLCLRTRAELSRRYGYLLLHTYDLKKVFYGLGSGLRQNLSWTDFKLLPCLVPPLSEQHAIVRYLNHRDRRIRRYVSAKRKLIALLEEEKQAIINQAATRGLDPNVRLKPSGVEWLGDVPEHWERCRLRNVVLVVTTGSRGWSSYASDTGPLFIRVANLNRGSLSLRFDDTVRLNLPETAEITRTRIQAGDLLISVTAYIGSVGLAPEEFEEAYVSQHVARCQPRPGSYSRWLGYVLLSAVGQTHGQISLYGGTKDGLSLDDVKNYPILLPPLAEQLAIVKYLDKVSADIDAAIARARRQVELVQEYCTRLIADVVTGKLDVRGTPAHLPEEEDEELAVDEGDPLAPDTGDDLDEIEDHGEE